MARSMSRVTSNRRGMDLSTGSRNAPPPNAWSGHSSSNPQPQYNLRKEYDNDFAAYNPTDRTLRQRYVADRAYASREAQRATTPIVNERLRQGYFDRRQKAQEARTQQRQFNAELKQRDRESSRQSFDARVAAMRSQAAQENVAATQAEAAKTSAMLDAQARRREAMLNFQGQALGNMSTAFQNLDYRYW